MNGPTIQALPRKPGGPSLIGMNKLHLLFGTLALGFGLAAQGPAPQPSLERGVVDALSPGIPDDPDLAKAIAPYAAEIHTSFGRVIGFAPVELPNGWPQGLSPLGFLLADGMREEAARAIGGEVRCAFTNSGGIRRGIPAGPVSIGSIYEALPFDNELVVAEYTGAEVVAIVKEGIQAKGGEPGSGVRVSVTGNPEQPKVSITWSDGAPIQASGTFRVATTDYLLANGDRTPTLKRGRHVILTSKPVRQILIDACERLHRGPQHVVVRVEKALVPLRSADVQREFLRSFASAQDGNRPRPEHPQRPELGNLHEEVRAHRHGKTHLRRGDIHFKPATMHFAQVINAGGKGKGEFLHGVAARLVPGAAVDADGLQPGRMDRGPPGQRSHFAVGPGQGLRKLALV